jgi:AcrR family transcriptional regulator
MPRTVKDHDERYAEFLGVAQQLFFTQGYERTTVQEIIDTVGVAKGTFYHYFDSKQAILEALVAELSAQTLALFEAIVADETLNAIQKWAHWVQVYGDWKIQRKAELLAIIRVMQADENVLLSYKLRKRTSQMAVPTLTRIVSQGIEEGVFETVYVEEAAEIAYAISRIVSDSVAGILLNPDTFDYPGALARRKIAAGQAAIERVLGAAPGSLPLADEQMIATWFED